MRVAFSAALLVSLTCSAASAQVVLEKLPEGRSYWQFDRDGDRVIAKQMRVVASGPTVPTFPDDTDDPLPASQFHRDLVAAVSAIDEPVLAGAVSQTFQEIANTIESASQAGKPLNPQAINRNTKRAFNLLLAATDKDAEWHQIADIISAELVARAQEGQLDYVDVYREVAAAMSASSIEAFSPALLLLIVKVIRVIFAGGELDAGLIGDLIALIFKGRATMGLL